MIGADINASVRHARIAQQVGAAIDGSGRTAIGVTPAHAAREAGAPGIDRGGGSGSLKIRRRVVETDEGGGFIQGVSILPALALPGRKTGVATKVTPQD